MVLVITFQNHEIYNSCKTEFYENDNAVTFYLWKTSSFYHKFSLAEIDPSMQAVRDACNWIVCFNI